ncbi:MAG: hypothetical protein UH850_11600 [Paludibacteraceae bacterium]|nr:hypothetical protein [Paludibacteraceae bacterium]
MNFKINRTNYLLGVITLLFVVALGMIAWLKGANAIHKDIRLRIDTLDLNHSPSYYRSNSIGFTLKDSFLLNEEYYSCQGKYLVFEETREGYHVPSSLSYIPSFLHPSAACLETYRRYNHGDTGKVSINNIMKPSSISVDPDMKFVYRQIIKKAQARGASFVALMPSYTDSKYILKGEEYYSPGDFTDIEINGQLLSELAQKVTTEEPEEIVDSLMNGIYNELSQYCAKEHCNVGNNYAAIVSNAINSEKTNALEYLFSEKKDKAKKCIKTWLENHTEQIRQLAKECPEVYNAAHQLSDSYHYVDSKNHIKLDSLFTSSNYKNWNTNIIVSKTVEKAETSAIEEVIVADTILYESNEVNEVLKLIGHDGKEKDLRLLLFNINFWSHIWKEGEAEWTNKWMKKIME